MKCHNAIVLLLISWLLVLDIYTASSVIPICLTWNSTGRNLAVECTVHVTGSAKDITIVDPSGNIRVNCTLGESPSCSGSLNHVLHEDIFENLTTLTVETEKNNTEGEWKCRHENKEANSIVTYKKGSFSTIDIVISGEILKTKEKYEFRLGCFSCKKPYNDGADFYVNNKLEDSIRYQDGLCYHKRNVCHPEKCTCSSKGNIFFWNFFSNMSTVHFTCAMRFKDKLKYTIHKGHIQYNGSDCIQTYTTNTSIDYADNNPDITYAEKKKTGHIGYWIFGIACLVILTVLLICVLRIYMKRKREGNDEERKNVVHELTPLQNFESTCNEQISCRTCSVDDINIACLSHNDDQEIEYANTLKTYLQKLGFRSCNITFINEDSLDDYFSKALKTAIKLIIVIPDECKLNDGHFNLVVETALRIFKENHTSTILPIVRSKEAILPPCLNNMIYFTSLEPKLKDTVMQCSETERIDQFVSSIRNICNVVSDEKSPGQLSISPYARDHFANFGLELLKGCGVDIEKDRVSFHMNTFNNLSNEQYVLLHDIVPFIFRNRSFRFLRLYDVVQFDFRDLQLHSNIYQEVIKIFKLIIDMKGESWYHYRRNGLGHKGSSEGAFKLVKQVFMDKEPSVIFHQFDTNESRLASFQNYPIELEAFRKRLAQAGFFYFNVSDYVQCFNCGGCLRVWMPMDDPMERHRRNFKTCPFVLESKKINLPEEDSTYKSCKMNNSLNTPGDRLCSFQCFPVELSEEDLQRLSKAGFYYCGIAEDIVCYECNIGFAGVENIDTILRLHEKYSQDCRNTDNLATIKDADDQEYISNFVQYLELECRHHDF